MKIVDPKIKHKGKFAGMIIWIIARYYHIGPDQLIRQDKKRRISEARTFCYHFIRVYTNLTFGGIGILMDRSHSNVLQMDVRLRGMISVNDRAVLSKYIEIKYNIDEAVRKIYPRTFGFRISTFKQDKKITA